MFTGLVSHVGKLIAFEQKNVPTLTLESALVEKVKIGDSVAVNGACLTAVELNGRRCKFNLSRETLQLSNFADLGRGSYLNLELPLTVNDFLGGHLVSGHLDGMVRLKSLAKKPGSTMISFIYQNRAWRKFLVHKGSVTLNGVSLTLSEVRSSFFAVEVIPHTLAATNLKYLKPGERVNLELDLIAKYLYNINLYK